MTNTKSFLSKTIKNLSRELRKPKVYALVGASGTGKSFRSKLVAKKYDIHYLIDDGLLIHNERIIAGRSAKKEKIYVKAIKTALFDDPKHLEEVKNKIKENNITKILLIGTSDKMVEKITQRLKLPPISLIIRIEDIASREEIRTALKHRKAGNHVIPVPSLEVKKDHATIFAHTIKVFFSQLSSRKNKEEISFEKTVVKPPFQDSKQKGKVIISEIALNQMLQHCIDEFDSSIEIEKIKIRTTLIGYRITIHININYGKEINSLLSELQNYIIESIEKYTGIQIEEVIIEVNHIKR